MPKHAQRGDGGIAPIHSQTGSRGWVVRNIPAALPPGETRYPLYRILGGPQRRSERARKMLPPPGFDPRTVQPLASRCTD